MSSTPQSGSQARRQLNFNLNESSSDIERWVVAASKVNPEEDSVYLEGMYKTAVEKLRGLQKDLQRTEWMFQYGKK
jgi:hypothetical protein